LQGIVATHFGYGGNINNQSFCSEFFSESISETIVKIGPSLAKA